MITGPRMGKPVGANSHIGSDPASKRKIFGWKKGMGPMLIRWLQNKLLKRVKRLKDPLVRQTTNTHTGIERFFGKISVMHQTMHPKRRQKLRYKQSKRRVEKTNSSADIEK